MESIFELSEGERAAYLQQMTHSFGCTFISLWSYLPHPTNCLIFMDGVYHEQYLNQAIASSSSGTSSLPRRLFDLYQKSLLSVDNGCVPGYAFKNSIPYLELKGLELQKLASTQVQLQFYQEARIKTAIFMGCKVGEIELGISIDSQVNFEAEMRNLFPQDFSRQVVPRELLQATDQTTNLPPSSSSPLISLSLHISDDTTPIPIIQQPSVPAALIQNTATYDSFQQALESLHQIRNVQFPTIESEDAAITKAILAVISSSPSPTSSASTSSHQPKQKTSAFKSYNRSVLGPSSQMTRRVQRQNVLKRAVEFIRSSSLMRGPDQTGSRSSSKQLQHMIKERKRREKLNEVFEALRSLLPPGSKKAKASVLSSTVEYMSALKAEVEELTSNNQRLLSQLQQNNEANVNNTSQGLATGDSSFDTADHHRHVDVRITNVAETTSEAQMLDLRVSVRGGESMILDIEIRVLELLKQVKNGSLLSIEASTRMVGSSISVTDFVWRLKIEGDEWDETSFVEAVRRVVADLAQ